MVIVRSVVTEKIKHVVRFALRRLYIRIFIILKNGFINETNSVTWLYRRLTVGICKERIWELEDGNPKHRKSATHRPGGCSRIPTAALLTKINVHNVSRK